MARVNLALGATVFVLWFVLGGERALNAIANYWQISVTMVFGSLVGGGTSEGGGAVAFPVMTKVLSIPAPEARLFTFAIQSCGMGAASLSIIINRVPVEWRAIRNGAPFAVAGVVFSSLVLTPLVDAPSVRLLFTAILASLALALFISRRLAPGRRDWLEPCGNMDRVVIMGAGLAGGLLSGVAGLGENAVMFTLLVLGFRVCERVITPTTVILLTVVSLTGFTTHLFLMNDFTGPVVDRWLAAVPIVAFGAPTGALICTRMSRDTIVRILYALIGVEFLSTLLLVPMTPERAVLFGVAIVAFSALCVWLATHPRYHVPIGQEAVAAGAG
jgi:uncharacterized membrane protein YfcA